MSILPALAGGETHTGPCGRSAAAAVLPWQRSQGTSTHIPSPCRHSLDGKYCQEKTTNGPFSTKIITLQLIHHKALRRVESTIMHIYHSPPALCDEHVNSNTCRAIRYCIVVSQASAPGLYQNFKGSMYQMYETYIPGKAPMWAIRDTYGTIH